MSDPEISLGRAASAAEGDLRLPRPPGLIRRFWARHPWWTDGIVAGFYLFPALLGAVSALAIDPFAGFALPYMIVTLVSAPISVAAVLLRRRFPLIALTTSIAVMFATSATLSGSLSIGVAILLYSVAVYRSNRDAWIGLVGAGAALVIGAYLPWPPGANTGSQSHAEITFIVGMLLAVLIGVNVGNRKRYLEALIDRAAQLARERDQQALLATAAERSRIAREMHDIVSHSLTVMVTLADGSAAVTSSDPGRAHDAMVHVAETGRHALTDMRRMLGVLNEPVDSNARFDPQPGTDDLETLAESFRAAGMPLRLSVTGSTPGDPALQLTVYRVLQESLTNVLRHASDATRVDAAIEYGVESVTVRVDDDGRMPAAATSGAGRGLVGVRERVALYDGELRSGPRPSGGWRIVATLGRPEPIETAQPSQSADSAAGTAVDDSTDTATTATTATADVTADAAGAATENGLPG